jgi:undecaprenyl-diphosphatase
MPQRPADRRQAARLGEPISEEFVGRRDLTHWSRLGQWLVRFVLITSRFVSAHTVLLVSAVVGAALVTALSTASAEIYDNVKDADGLSGLDEPALELAMSLRNPANVAVIQFFTNLGGWLELTIITASVLVIMTLRWRSWTPLMLLVIGVAGSLLMTVVGKDLVGRARPPQADAVPPYETSPSFPSGHTLNSTAIASLIAYLLLLHLTSLLARALSVVCAVLWFVAMGLSRVFLGYHWLTDVMAGWTLGLAWVALVITSHRLFLTVRRERRQRASVDAGPASA